MAAPVRMLLSSAEKTADLAAWLGRRLNPGDCVLLQGDLGAGKTHFARAAIQARLLDAGIVEDVPSPTYTLVQTYADETSEIWHCDLYRLSGPDETEELGLIEAIETSICFVEWPDRLEELAPDNALSVTLKMTEQPGQRLVTFSATDRKWHARLAALQAYVNGS